MLRGWSVLAPTWRDMNTGRTASGPVGGIKSPLAGPIVVRTLLGARMRRFREASGITCADAGYAIRGSHSKISRMELGRLTVRSRAPYRPADEAAEGPERARILP